MPLTEGSQQRWWLLLFSSASLFGILLLLSLYSRQAIRLDNDPYILEPPAGPTANLATAVNLFDGVTVRQTVIKRAGFATDARIGITNGRNASPDATISLELRTAHGKQQLAVTTQRVGDLRYEELVLRGLNRHLSDDQHYVFTLSTSGVPSGSDLSLHYKHNDASVGRLERRFGDDAWEKLPGALGIGILHRATIAGVLGNFAVSDLVILGLYAAFLAVLWRPAVRNWLERNVAQRTPLAPAPRLGRVELTLVALIACLLALLFTLPFYTNRDYFSNQDDVHTAVTYRAAARDAVVQEQALPLWDNWQCGGRPLTANVESAHLDPFFWLLVVPFGADLGTRLSVTATLALMFLGSYVLVRRCAPADRLPALFAASVISYSGFVVLGLAQGFFAWIPIGFVPWAVWLGLESWRRPILVISAGLIAAWLFLGGSIHMTLYALVMLGCLSLAGSIVWRTTVALVRSAAVGLFAALFAAVKLLPAAELQTLTSSFERPLEWLTPLRYGWAFFTDSSLVNPDKISLVVDGVALGPDQFAFYVGLVPVLAFMASAWWWRKPQQWLFVGPAVVFLLMTFALPPWTWLQELPILDELLRNPQRWRWPLTFMAMLLAAYSLTRYQRLLPRWLGPALVAGLAVVVVTDLYSVNGPLFKRVYRFPVPELVRDERFTVRDQSFKNHPAGDYYRATYFSYLRNRGTKDSCINYLFALPLNTRGHNNLDPLAPYRGEVWLANGGDVTDYTVAPTSWSVSFQTSEPNIVVINQNYHLGWRTEPPRDVIRYEGLVAAQVEPDDTELTFRYDPWTVKAGALVSFLTALTALLYWRSTIKCDRAGQSSASESTSVLPSR